MFWTHLCLIHEWRFRSRTLILTMINKPNQTQTPFYAVNLPQMYIYFTGSCKSPGGNIGNNRNERGSGAEHTAASLSTF